MKATGGTCGHAARVICFLLHQQLHALASASPTWPHIILRGASSSTKEAKGFTHRPSGVLRGREGRDQLMMDPKETALDKMLCKQAAQAVRADGIPEIDATAMKHVEDTPCVSFSEVNSSRTKS